VQPISECRKASLSFRIVADTDQHANMADGFALLSMPGKGPGCR
jgi:hypothetical protein